MWPRTSSSICMFSFLLILLLVKVSCTTQSPPRRRVRQLSPHSNPLLSRTKTNERTHGAQLQLAPDDLVPLILWEEEEEALDTKPSTSTNPETTQRKRKLLWWSGTLEDRPWLDMDMDDKDNGKEKERTGQRRRKRKLTKDSEPESQPQPQPQPHPLRTDVWKLTVRWRQHPHPHPHPHPHLQQSKKKAAKNEMLLEFADNGYVRLCPQTNDTSTSDKSKIPIGTWKLDPSGLSWHLPLNDREHYFFADIHLNPFGKYPKMTRGIVIREHEHAKGNDNDNDNDNDKEQSWKKSPSTWFRPIVATFVGKGIGIDTADFSYRHRNFGLYQQAEKQE